MVRPKPKLRKLVITFDDFNGSAVVDNGAAYEVIRHLKELTLALEGGMDLEPGFWKQLKDTNGNLIGEIVTNRSPGRK
jgi:hypothetical protein